MCCAHGRADVYVPGDFITIKGSHLKLDQHDPAQGVFIRQQDGSEIRCAMYGGRTRLQVSTIVPDTVSGPIHIRVATHIYGSVRSTVYPTPLQQMPPLIPG